MAEITLRSKKQIYNRRPPALRLVSGIPVINPPKVTVKKDLLSDHKFFINSLFCEMAEKI